MARIPLISAILTLACATLAHAQGNTEHGYRYFHHLKNEGKKPQRGEAIIAHVDVYAGKTLLSSSKKTSAGVYRYNIPPATDTLQHYPPLMDATMLMSKGDSLTIFQTVDENMRKYLPPAEKDAKEIRFEIVLLDLVSAEQIAEAERALNAAVQNLGTKVQNKAKAYAAGQLGNEVLSFPSGLKMLIEVGGRGEPVKEGEPLQVHYYGCLLDGTMFDNSFARRQPIQFPAGSGQMINGFDEGVMKLRHGSKAYLFIPPALGYGDAEAGGGLIPPNSELVFYIEIF